ncbi:MAG TPA: FHA domain-containing protein [Phycisphaerae bacterium]|nr:FHA domain-containing protein [Phycisphaerae bacterium]HRW55140.1 FHA domain-containing protein [Phycisphaerae bacterium]
MPSLTILNGERNGAQFPLRRRIPGIGRDPVRDIHVRDPIVGRKHALAADVNGAHLLAPARALNGVIINAERIDSAHQLGDGDLITLGDIHSRVEGCASPLQIDALQQRERATGVIRYRNMLLMTGRDGDGATHGS